MDAAKEAFKKSNECDKKNIDPIFELAKIAKSDDPNQAENYLEQLNQIDLNKAAELKEIFNK